MADTNKRSIVIPVLDFSPHGPYNIRTLLDDLEGIEGEVICIFNSDEVYEELRHHKRIDKFCFNKLNAGVSRSWNMGIDMAEGSVCFIMNADLHIEPSALDGLEEYLFSLDKAVIVGPHGAIIDYKRMSDLSYFTKGSFSQPVACDAISGFLFALHMERYLEHNFRFDARFSPCFFEEWDLGLQIKQAGLLCYAVPVAGFEHHWGVSQAAGDRAINYFGRSMTRNEILLANREKFVRKWHAVINGNAVSKPFKTAGPVANDSADDAAGGDLAAGIRDMMAFIDKIQGQTYPEPVSEMHAYITRKMIDDFLNRYPLASDAKILDVGCGQGPALDIFREKGYRAVGITVNDEDIRVCRAKGHETHCMDQSFMTFPDASFDFIWVRHCIEHSIFPFFTLSGFFRVLKDGAFMYLEVPAPNTACHHENNINHYSVLTRESWASLIGRTGFQLLERTDLNFETAAGPDEYWAFICRKTAEAV